VGNVSEKQAAQFNAAVATVAEVVGLPAEVISLYLRPLFGCDVGAAVDLVYAVHRDETIRVEVWFDDGALAGMKLAGIQGERVTRLMDLAEVVREAREYRRQVVAAR